METRNYILALLEKFKRQGLEARATSLRVGLFGAGPWAEAMRAEIEQAFDIDALDIYGLSEVIDPVTGKVLPDGEEGEMVFTLLTKEAMPIIRGVNVFPSQIDEQPLRCRRLSPHYLIEASRAGRLDDARLLIEPRDPAANHAPAAQYGRIGMNDSLIEIAVLNVNEARVMARAAACRQPSAARISPRFRSLPATSVRDLFPVAYPHAPTGNRPTP
jgi:phenylacetate-coenzyme A ligase PaaK-like adenylate-forming protein